mgnify:CR=1 FL=1
MDAQKKPSTVNHGSLFSGIGGFDLASEWMGWENKFHCEWEDFPRKVLKYHFPNAISYGDIKQTDFTIWRGRIDILTGGFPCQPYSAAGKRLGKQDERHLFPEMLRAVRQIKPRWVVGENVRGLVSWNGGLVFEEVQSQLETEGYSVQPFLLPAAGVNAPHKRDRIWFVAYSSSIGRKRPFKPETTEEQKWKMGKSIQQNRNRIWGEDDGRSTDATDSNLLRRKRIGIDRVAEEKGQGREERFSELGNFQYKWEEFPTQPPICGANDGIPRELDSITFPRWRKESIKAYGNAIVPQLVLQIFRAIEKYEHQIRGEK